MCPPIIVSDIMAPFFLSSVIHGESAKYKGFNLFEEPLICDPKAAGMLLGSLHFSPLILSLQEPKRSQAAPALKTTVEWMNENLR